jgi:hypothetical protein
MIRFTCARCLAQMEVPEDQGGRGIACPRCGHVQYVPTLLPVEAPATAPRPAGARPAARLLERLRAVRLPVHAPWRYGSPAGLLLALVLFPLPWIEVRCDRPIDNSVNRTLVEQSGLQAAYGGYTESPTFRTERARRPAQNAPAEESLPGAPLMVLYGLCLTGGLLCGITVRRRLLRLAGLVGSSALALVLLYLQAHRGFPLEQAVTSPSIRDATAEALLRSVVGQSGLVEVRYTVWFWLTVAAVAASLLAALVEWAREARSSWG